MHRLLVILFAMVLASLLVPLPAEAATARPGSACQPSFAGAARCFSAPHKVRAERQPEYPIDPPGAAVWNMDHLRPIGEAVTRYQGTGPVTGIYWAFGRASLRPTWTPGSTPAKFVIVTETVHAITITPSSRGATPSVWNVTSVLPNTHVQLSVISNLSRAQARALVQIIIALAPVRMTVQVRSIAPWLLQQINIVFWKTWVRPRIPLAHAEREALQGENKNSHVVETALARVIDPVYGENAVYWVISMRENHSSCQYEVNVELINAWTGYGGEGFSGCSE